MSTGYTCPGIARNSSPPRRRLVRQPQRTSDRSPNSPSPVSTNRRAVHSSHSEIGSGPRQARRSSGRSTLPDPRLPRRSRSGSHRSRSVHRRQPTPCGISRRQRQARIPAPQKSQLPSRHRQSSSRSRRVAYMCRCLRLLAILTDTQNLAIQPQPPLRGVVKHIALEGARRLQPKGRRTQTVFQSRHIMHAELYLGFNAAHRREYTSDGPAT